MTTTGGHNLRARNKEGSTALKSAFPKSPAKANTAKKRTTTKTAAKPKPKPKSAGVKKATTPKKKATPKKAVSTGKKPGRPAGSGKKTAASTKKGSAKKASVSAKKRESLVEAVMENGQEAYASVKRALTVSLLGLMRADGGGWECG